MTTQIRFSERPMVTLALFAYAQEKYVAEAVRSALDQTYSPLQIILSDDSSPDRTFEVMRRMAAEYRGPHEILLNRNERNLNIARHLNAVQSLAKGELVVAAAGDDISASHRVERLVDAWLANGRKAGMLHSACSVIDENSAEVRPLLPCPCVDDLQDARRTAARNAFVIGATEAWARELFDTFGPLLENLTHEDRALPFRSLLLGRPVLYIEEPLVRYRQGVGLSATYVDDSRRFGPAERMQILQRLLVDFQQKTEDLKRVPNSAVAPIVARNLHRYRASMRFEQGIPGPSEFIALARVAGMGHVTRMMAKRMANAYKERK